MQLGEVLKLSKQLNAIIPDDKMELDISNMHKFDPLTMLMTGSIIKEYRLKYPDIPFVLGYNDNIGKSYAGTMGFFKYISEKIKIGKMPGEASGSLNYIPITLIDFDKLYKQELALGNYIELGNLIEKEASKLSKIVDRGNIEMHKLLTYLIREIMRNTPEHAETDKIWICGQYWPSYNLAEIAMLDEGIGIYNSISKNKYHREHLKDNRSALQWALKAGVSAAFNPSRKQKDDSMWANSGYGLFMISEICKYLNGSFCLISYDNYILIDNHGVNIGETFLNGTAIRIRVPCNRIIDAQEIISIIFKKGGEQSKSIRNAFKKASQTSRGLIKG